MPGGERSQQLLDSAYSFCCFGCCLQLDNWAHDRKPRKEITLVKVIFDLGGEHEIALKRGYEAFYNDNPHTYLSKVASFEDDDTVLPLQAAHLYAWLTSRAYNNKPSENQALDIIRRDGHATY